MKKILLLSLACIILVSACLLIVGCQSGSKDETTTTTTQELPQENPGTSSDEIKFQTDLTTLKEVIPAKPSETVEKIGYTVVTTDQGWSINSGVDYSVFDYIGSGRGLIETVTTKYKSKTVSYYSYEVETQSKKKLTQGKVEAASSVLAFITNDKDKKGVNVYIQELEMRVLPEYKSVEGKSGYFMTVPFNTNLPGTFSANISSKKGDTAGIIKHENIVTTGENGTYKGAAKLTVPFVDEGDYYVNIISGGKTCVASVPIKVCESEFTNRKYHLLYTGDWDLIKDPAYQSSLTELFYNTYARLYERWAITGNEPTTITFTADPTYDGVAYAMGTQVVVAVDYANSNPNDKGFFSHEITHSVQQYDFYYGDNAWWTENMASYGGFRYYHWSSANTIQLYENADQATLYDWGWTPYGDGSKWFLAYLDYRWPSSENEDGTLKLGLIDRINYEIKVGILKGKDDDARDPNKPFNKIVKEVTGYNCMEDIRKDYEKEFKSKEWDFRGFADYTDNFITENLPDVPNPIYPMISDLVHGDKTATPLDTIVTGDDNLCLDATIFKVSGFVKDDEAAAKLIDGDETTRWAALRTTDKTYSLDGTKHWVVIDLGEVKTFDTYTLFNVKSQAPGFNNMTEWEIMISDDAKTWTSVDYQVDVDYDKASFDIGEQSARYVMIKVFNGDGNNGIVRLYEFQLYNKEN